MSHTAERKEKDCLNCGTIVQGRYCQHCGQENIVPKETFWHMVTHFFYDITHFDTSFFHTIHHLLFRPGFLSKEYMIGRRASYLHPIKMYVFTSAFFFLLFFSFFKPTNDSKPIEIKTLNATERENYIISLQNRLKKDSTNDVLLQQLNKARDTNQVLTTADTAIKSKGVFTFRIDENEYSSIEQYDSAQQKVSPSQRDGWLTQRFARRAFEISEKYKDNPKEGTTKLLEGFFHRLPYLLFVSLPLFALLLKLVYIRRKQFYYADHGVFTIHLYVFSFILLLLVFLAGKLADWTGWGFFGFVMGALFIWMISYLYFAMRNFYGQGKLKTFFKFLLVAILSLLMMLFLFILFLIFSVATI